MKRFFGLITIFALAMGLQACAAMHRNPLLPVHDEVLVYQLPFDVAYLRALDALQNVQDWQLEYTEKEKGLIQVRNINYSGLDDADKRVVTFLIKKGADRGQTTVELAKESQQVLGAEVLIKAVSHSLEREVQA